MKTENIIHKEAIEKMKNMVEDIEVAILLSNLNKIPLGVNPMHSKKIEENGHIWFLSSLNSDHYSNILVDKRVQLLYSDPKSKQFLSVYGKAVLHTDKGILEELYTKEDDQWFDGVTAIELIAIEIVPVSAYYWDKSSHKLVDLIKDLIGSKSSKTKDSDNKTKGEIKL